MGDLVTALSALVVCNIFSMIALMRVAGAIERIAKTHAARTPVSDGKSGQ